MAESNFERMMQLINDVFDTKNDPDQLDVDETVIERLHLLHPATLSEQRDDNGPVAWILVIPTTTALMTKFLSAEITEQQLFDLTGIGDSYQAIYLCSATVLPEYRGKGIARQMTLDAINAIRLQHPIEALFVWPFSKEGAALAETIARLTNLPLLQKDTHK